MGLKGLFRVSLASLVLLILLLGSGMLLCFHWGPWGREQVLGLEGGRPIEMQFSLNGELFYVDSEEGGGMATRVFRTATGGSVSSLKGAWADHWLPRQRLLCGTTVYDALTGKESVRLALPPGCGRGVVGLSPDHRRLVVEQARPCLPRWTGPPEPLLALPAAFCGFRLWNAESLELMSECEANVKYWEHSLLFSPDGRYLLRVFRREDDARAGSREVEIWDAKTGRLQSKLQDVVSSTGYFGVSFSFPGEGILATDDAEHKKNDLVSHHCEWEIRSGRLLKDLITTHPIEMYDGGAHNIDLAYSRVNDAELRVDASDGVLFLMDSATRNTICEFGAFAINPSHTCGAFDAEGRRFLFSSGSADGGVWLFTRRRPERWWGLACLWEFWLTVALAAALAWSVSRDRRAL